MSPTSSSAVICDATVTSGRTCRNTATGSIGGRHHCHLIRHRSQVETMAADDAALAEAEAAEAEATQAEGTAVEAVEEAAVEEEMSPVPLETEAVEETEVPAPEPEPAPVAAPAPVAEPELEPVELPCPQCGAGGALEGGEDSPAACPACGHRWMP